MTNTTDDHDFKPFLQALTERPGVYRMLDADQRVLYVGKAKNLKKRVSSYFNKQVQSVKTHALVAKIVSIETTITANETEALLLEQTLIKSLKPPYNILLRDDKSYAYISLSTQHQYPSLRFHRGGKRNSGQFFGPYPSSGAVRESLNLLQKVFKVRQCDESFFRNRSRPCLQHQIDRCSAPCVNSISPEDYADSVRLTRLFLEGKNQTLIEELVESMESASSEQAYEQAARFRDQIIALRRVQETQYVEGDTGNVDIIAAQATRSAACVHILIVRQGRVLGSKNYFPKVLGETDLAAILGEFIPQYYLGSQREIPQQIITNEAFEGSELLAMTLAERVGQKVTCDHRVRSQRAGWLKLALINAEQNLASHISNRENIYNRFVDLQELLSLDEMPNRLECFDISHTQGEATVASCVVFDQNGPLKSDYRRFDIKNITPGDDYAAMEQALTRRYTRIKQGEGKLPDILFIDGGKGQLSKAALVFRELQVDGVLLIGVAKGTSRKPGLEKLWRIDAEQAINSREHNSALSLIQHIRDESHRFAISGHRAQRGRARKRSSLEEIPGVGPKRRRSLLNHFGGLQEILRASEEDLIKAPGISPKMAELIYAKLHND